MFIGLDLGTSGIKALLVDEKGHIMGTAHASLTHERPHEGWSEQNPEHWIDAADRVMQALASEYPKEIGGVKAIGLSGQMHGATLIDAGQTRPSMLWNDVRSAKRASKLDANPSFRAISGNIVFPGFTAPKVVWVKKMKITFSKVLIKYCFLKIFYAYGLRVIPYQICQTHSGTSWLDVGARAWSAELLAACDLTEDHMPRLVEGSEASGATPFCTRNQMGHSRRMCGGGWRRR